jgi:hypothetical protein
MALLPAVAPAWGQSPSQAQISAIRASCKSDYRAHCASVTPGGPEALACLRQNLASLSASCQQAVNAVGGSGARPAAAAPSTTAAPPAAAAPPSASQTPGSAIAPAPAPAAPPAARVAPADVPEMSPLQELAIIRRACGSDYRALCGAVQPGGGRVVQCLRTNEAQLSPRCRRALASALGR